MVLVPIMMVLNNTFLSLSVIESFFPYLFQLEQFSPTLDYEPTLRRFVLLSLESLAIQPEAHFHLAKLSTSGESKPASSILKMVRNPGAAPWHPWTGLPAPALRQTSGASPHTRISTKESTKDHPLNVHLEPELT